MRKAFLVVNVLLILDVLAQFYLAALGVFSNPEDGLFGLHGMNGSIILSALILVWIIIGFFAHIGGKNIGLTFLVLGLRVLQTLFFILGGLLGASPPPNESLTPAASYVMAGHGLNGAALLLVVIWVFFRVKRMDPYVRPVRGDVATGSTADSTAEALEPQQSPAQPA